MEVSTQTRSTALSISDNDLITVLQTSLYPGAALPSIKMVLEYCKASNLDPMQKPVHIVPMWNAKEGRMVDVIMPGVNLYRTQAARSGQFAGMSEPEFGPEIIETIDGVKIAYPDWCKVTVKRVLPNGVIAEFSSVEYWKENYAVKGGKDKSIAPNAMWQKRPRGQLAKCASAQALRIAFPEIASQPTADEMEGKQLYQNEVDVTPGKSATDIGERARLTVEMSDEDRKKLVDRLQNIADTGTLDDFDFEWGSAFTSEQRAAVTRGKAGEIRATIGNKQVAREPGEDDE